jgi:hypothetical protein
MELGRRPDSTVTPGDDKMAEVGRLVDYGVDAGLFGRRPSFRSRPTRSLFANFAEYRAYTATVNRRDAVFRAIPHIQTGWTTAPLIDPFLDLRVDYGNDLRCYRVVGNADPEHLE